MQHHVYNAPEMGNMPQAGKRIYRIRLTALGRDMYLVKGQSRDDAMDRLLEVIPPMEELFTCDKFQTVRADVSLREEDQFWDLDDMGGIKRSMLKLDGSGEWF